MRKGRVVTPAVEGLLTLVEAGEVLGIGRTRMYQLVRRKELPVVRVGRLVRVRKADLEAWIAARKER